MMQSISAEVKCLSIYQVAMILSRCAVYLVAEAWVGRLFMIMFKHSVWLHDQNGRASLFGGRNT
eukprot:scaffold18698_cov66-Skeletonema_marinoi.AAC.1